MKKLFALAVCLSILSIQACKGETLTGVYRETFQSGNMTDVSIGDCKPPLVVQNDICVEPYEGENTLGIYQTETGNLDFSMVLYFFNGHSCMISGNAAKSETGWAFENAESGNTCKLLINLKDNKIVFNVAEGTDCSYYCGARGNLDNAEFSLTSKTRITVNSPSDLECIASMEEPCSWNNNEAEKQ